MPGMAALFVRHNRFMHIGAYISGDAEFRDYDAAAVSIANQLKSLIRKRAPGLKVEHVGSTAVPGCGGKGVIDLAVLYPEGLLGRARTVLQELGFQSQGGPEPFPETRPMRVGCVEHDGRAHRIHAHVIALGSEEHEELVWFRDALCSDPALRRSYEEKKRAIVSAGIHDALDYCKAKGAFITQTLARRLPSQQTSPPTAPSEELPGSPRDVIY